LLAGVRNDAGNSRFRDIEYFCTTPKMLLFGRCAKIPIMGALAEFERDLIRERTKAGMKAAKRRGKHLGRPPALTEEQITHARKVIKSDGETISGMASVLGVGRNTLSRALNNGK
jgi:DNA invertase Pin-like site-specific DNA recombinase